MATCVGGRGRPNAASRPRLPTRYVASGDGGLSTGKRSTTVGDMCQHPLVTDDEVWRPLGVDTEEAIAAYDALHEGVPDWIEESIWSWVTSQLPYDLGARQQFLMKLSRELRVRINTWGNGTSVTQLRAAFRAPTDQIKLLDALLRHTEWSGARNLDAILQEGGSAWKVGARAGCDALVQRVPGAVQRNAERVMHTNTAAAVDLRKAWDEVFGVAPNPSEAYRLAVRAAEHATIPAVVPKQDGATLGHVIGRLKNDGDWSLPLTREHPDAPTASIVLGMCRALWFGQHDRHGGEPSAPGNVNQEEAETAVTLAVTLVQWFTSGAVARRSAGPHTDQD